MADLQIGNQQGVAAASATAGVVNTNGGAAASTGYTDTDQDTITALKARLTTIDGTFYTAARLSTMTYNDLTFAVRSNDTPLSIKQ